MRVVIALGGNALLKRGETMTTEHQRQNVKSAVTAIAQAIEAGHEVIVTHGDGPQIGLLALQENAYDQALASPLDILGAKTDGMIGYIIEQELGNLLAPEQDIAVLLTQIEVDDTDPAFKAPSKPIGPQYTKDVADQIAKAKGWTMIADGNSFRRVVASPAPVRILEAAVIELLVGHGVIVICAGGGGIPVIRKEDDSFVGVEAVIDKDHASRLLANSLHAQALLMLTDADGVYLDWGTAQAKRLTHTTPQELTQHAFAEGSMGPKIKAACDFLAAGGEFAGIGRPEDALAIIERRAGTIISNGPGT
jgi:carbamate kinase